jgi:hypothetical protein
MFSFISDRYRRYQSEVRVKMQEFTERDRWQAHVSRYREYEENVTDTVS